jgi:hypothetical protein
MSRLSQTVDVPDNFGEFFEFAYERGWTDGLPVVPPTPELVELMFGQLTRDPQDVIARVPPAMGEATVERIAVNAVMAGCKPAYMPVLMAAVEAMCAPEFNLTNIQTTGDSTTPGIILNGPVRSALEINCKEGATGPGSRANATIGRAIRLILLNVGGGSPGTVDRSMLGQPAKYSFCLGEDEEHSPWEPFHVSRGFAAAESVVTVVPVLYTQFAWPLVVDVATVLNSMADAMATPSHSNSAYFDAPVSWIVPPANAGLLARAGHDRRAVQEYLFEHARIPATDYPQSRDQQMWDYKLHIEGGDVLVVDSPDDVFVWVAGGDDYTGALYLGGAEASRPVSVSLDAFVA